MRTLRFISLLILILVTACQPRPTSTAGPAMETPAETPGATQPVETASPSPTLLPTMTPTAEPGRAIMVLPENSDPFYADLLSAWQAEAAALGYDLAWGSQGTLSAGDLDGNVRLVVAAPGALTAESLQSLAAAAPQAHFVVFDAGISPGANISVVSPPRIDQAAFIAGYVAALITDDWRVGVLSPTDTPAGQAASSGFLNGAVFFCGLCNPYYGPIVDYPLVAGRPAAASSAEWVAAAQELIDQAVTTVFLAPGVDDAAMLALLADNGVRMMGTQPRPESLADSWVLSLLPDDQALQALLPGFLSGAAGQAAALSVAIGDVNPEMLSPGRQAFAASVIADVLAGIIDTGVVAAP